MYEPRRQWEENSQGNYEYIRDSFLLPFFGDMTLTEANSEELILQFMREIADRQFSVWVAKKVFTYLKSYLDTANAAGLIQGNAARLIPKNRRIPKGVKVSKSQPFVSLEQYVALRNEIEKPRDRMLLSILFMCAVRRGELFVIKWKDWQVENGMNIFMIQRSFCSQTHKVKEWTGKVAGTGKTPAKVVVPPSLAADIEGWKQFGDSKSNDPESYIFPTRNGTPIIPTNWVEDVLKPAGKRVAEKHKQWSDLENVSLHWFRRGHATEQHHQGKADKAIQGQLRHADVELTRNVYMQAVDPETHSAVVELEKRATAMLNSKGSQKSATKRSK